MNLTKRGQYSEACNKFFEIKHYCFNETLFNHPNVYFNTSLRHHISYRDDGKAYLIILYILNNLLSCINFKILKLKIYRCIINYFIESKACREM